MARSWPAYTRFPVPSGSRGIIIMASIGGLCGREEDLFAGVNGAPSGSVWCGGMGCCSPAVVGDVMFMKCGEGPGGSSWAPATVSMTAVSAVVLSVVFARDQGF